MLNSFWFLMNNYRCVFYNTFEVHRHGNSVLFSLGAFRSMYYCAYGSSVWYTLNAALRTWQRGARRCDNLLSSALPTLLSLQTILNPVKYSKYLHTLESGTNRHSHHKAASASCSVNPSERTHKPESSVHSQANTEEDVKFPVMTAPWVCGKVIGRITIETFFA